jgi:hypothetical protein
MRLRPALVVLRGIEGMPVAGDVRFQVVASGQGVILCRAAAVVVAVLA